MSGVKGKSGRKRKNLTTGEAMRRLTMKLPNAIDTITETADGINKERLRYEAAVEVKDSCLGRPKLTTELEGGEALAAGLIGRILMVASEYRRKQLIEGDYREVKEEGDSAIKQGKDEGTQEARQVG